MVKGMVKTSRVYLDIRDYDEFVDDIPFKGKTYRIFYNPIIKKFLANEILSVKKNILLKNPAINQEVLREWLKKYESLPKDQQALTLKAFRRKIEEKQKKKSLDDKAKLKKRGRPAKPYLRKATLWAIKNQEIGEQRRQVIKRAYEKYKNESPNLKSFSTTVTKIWNETRDNWKEQKQKDEAKITIPLKVFAEKFLKVSFKVNKNRHKKKFAEIK